MSRRRGIGALLLALSVATAGWARVGLARVEGAGREGRPLLYLPNGRHLRAMTLGHAPLAADLLYLWAIQYYSDYRRADRFRFVEHVFGTVIADLDPRYIDPYWLGAMILTVEAGDLEGGLRILEKGLERNPDAWVLAYLAGFECYRAGQYDRAAGYFGRAARVEGAPSAVRRARAGMLARHGDLREAIAGWREVLEDPGSDAATRAIAERQIRDLTIRADVANLEAGLREYRARFGRFPRRLRDLAERGIVASVPTDPDGAPYRLDPASGRVSSAAGRVLVGR